MSPDHRNDLVLLKELLHQVVPEEVRTPPHLVVLYQGLTGPRFAVHGISPHKIAEQSCFRNLSEPVDLLDVIELI